MAALIGNARRCLARRACVNSSSHADRWTVFTQAAAYAIPCHKLPQNPHIGPSQRVRWTLNAQTTSPTPSPSHVPQFVNVKVPPAFEESYWLLTAIWRISNLLGTLNRQTGGTGSSRYFPPSFFVACRLADHAGLEV